MAEIVSLVLAVGASALVVFPTTRLFGLAGAVVLAVPAAMAVRRATGRRARWLSGAALGVLAMAFLAGFVVTLVTGPPLRSVAGTAVPAGQPPELSAPKDASVPKQASEPAGAAEPPNHAPVAPPTHVPVAPPTHVPVAPPNPAAPTASTGAPGTPAPDAAPTSTARAGSPTDSPTAGRPSAKHDRPAAGTTHGPGEHDDYDEFIDRGIERGMQRESEQDRAREARPGTPGAGEPSCRMGSFRPQWDGSYLVCAPDGRGGNAWRRVERGR